MSYAIAGYLATAVVLGGYLAWVVVRSREVAARLLAIQDGHTAGGPAGGGPAGGEGAEP